MWLTVMLALGIFVGCGPVTLEQPPAPTERSSAEPAAPTSEVAQAPAEPTAPAAEPAPTTTQLQSSDTIERGQAPQVPAQPPDASGLAPLSAVEVVDQVWPAVVTVVNEQQVGPFGEGDVQQAGRGTGFIIDEQGHIVTNQHVVSESDQLEVIFSDGEKRAAELVGADPLSDLAVVRVEGELPAIVSFGNSEQIQVGQPVLAIGSPLGEFSGTVTDGIVSAVNRDFPGETGAAEYNNLIQHNAAINPGNSGGPLFDFAGQVVGVNTLGIPVSSDGVPVQGIFFAIPSNSVSRIASQIIENGRAIYPYFGATPGEITPELAAQYDLPVDHGAFLMEVAPNSPASEAGIQAEDIVVAIGDLALTAQRSFSEALFQFEPGQTVPVTIIRGTEEIQTEVTLGERRR
jgi:2-alkenal reductase